MLHLSKTKAVLSVLTVGVPVLLFFQNCSPAAISSATSSLASSQTSESLTIVPPSTVASDIQLDDPAPTDGSKYSIGRCDQLLISDILLKISSISSNASNVIEKSFEIVDSDKTITLDKLTLKIRAAKTETISELTLVLNSSGNKILSSDNVAMDLSVNANEQSVIRVQVKNVSVVAGQVYSLVLEVNPTEQVVTNKAHCLFKPIVREALLSSL